MNYYLAVVFGFSILIAGVVALYRFKKIHSSYYPFLLCIWLGCINEIASVLQGLSGYSNAITTNIYSLAEMILLILFLKNFNQATRFKKIFYVIIGALTILWLVENFVFQKITSVSVYFAISYSFTVVILSISSINLTITKNRRNIFRNSEFLICACLIIYFTFKILIEAFWLYGLNESGEFLGQVYHILSYINLFCNLIFALAILWMPKKQVFTMPY